MNKLIGRITNHPITVKLRKVPVFIMDEGNKLFMLKRKSYNLENAFINDELNIHLEVYFTNGKFLLDISNNYTIIVTESFETYKDLLDYLSTADPDKQITGHEVIDEEPIALKW